MEMYREDKPVAVVWKPIQSDESSQNLRARICHPFPCQYFSGSLNFDCLVRKNLNVHFITPAEDDECCALDLTGMTRCFAQSVVSVGKNKNVFLCVDHFIVAVANADKINQRCKYDCGFDAVILDGQQQPFCLDIECMSHLYQ